MYKITSKTLVNRLQLFLLSWIKVEYKLVLYKIGVSWTMCLWPLKLWNESEQDLVMPLPNFEKSYDN